MFWNTHKPMVSDEYKKLQNQIVELEGKVGGLRGEVINLQMELQDIRVKIRKSKTPPDDQEGSPGGLPKGLNTFKPFV